LNSSEAPIVARLGERGDAVSDRVYIRARDMFAKAGIQQRVGRVWDSRLRACEEIGSFASAVILCR
jgi:hypothetical protein